MEYIYSRLAHSLIVIVSFVNLSCPAYCVPKLMYMSFHYVI